jgi:hypothetical protein
LHGISFRPACFGARSRTPGWVPVQLELKSERFGIAISYPRFTNTDAFGFLLTSLGQPSQGGIRYCDRVIATSDSGRTGVDRLIRDFVQLSVFGGDRAPPTMVDVLRYTSSAGHRHAYCDGRTRDCHSQEHRARREAGHRGRRKPTNRKRQQHIGTASLVGD